MAKSTSVFDDPTAGIQNLTAAVNKDINALKAAVLDLQILIKSQSEGGKISQDAANHSTVIVDILKESLTNTTKEFNEVLTTRAKVRFMSSIAYFSPLFHSFMQLRHSRIYTIICRS